MQTILIPTDFSKNALRAIQFALHLFKCERAQFYFLHAFAEKVYGTFKTTQDISIEQKRETVRLETDKKLAQLVENVKGIPPNPRHTYESVSICESLVDAVNDFVNEINIDLVLMGTKGNTDNLSIGFGSQTVQVFKYVRCPVLAIPFDCEFQQPKKILFPTDYMLPYKRRELKLLNELSRQFKSEIHCLYISDFDELSHRQLDNRSFLTDSLPDSYLYFERRPLKNKTETIREYIRLKDIDFLVMVNARHSLLEDLLYRSTVEEIGLTTKIPFLVMQNLPR